MVFLLVIIELFFSLSVMVDALRANIDSKSAFFKGVGQFGPKISGRKRHPPPTIVHR